MNESQRATLLDVTRAILGWHHDRVIWDGTPRPALIGGSDATRPGLCELRQVSFTQNGASVERRTKVAGSGVNAIRTVTQHVAGIVRVQFDIVTVDPARSCEDLCYEVALGLEDETRNQALEDEEISWINSGAVLALPFSANGGAFSRAAVEVAFNVAFDRIDRTAEPGVIVSTYPGGVIPL